MVCSQCGRTVHDHDRFCMYCGHALTNDKTSVESRMKEDSHIEDIRDEKRSKRSAVNHVNLKHEAKILFDHTTKSIGKFAGSEEVLNLNLKDMFSEVFKFHSRDESEEIFIAGTKKQRLCWKKYLKSGENLGYFQEYSWRLLLHFWLYGY